MTDRTSAVDLSAQTRREGSRLLRSMWRARWPLYMLDSLVGAVFFLIGMVPGLIMKAFFDALSGWPATTGWTGPLLVLVLFGVKFLHCWTGVLYQYVDAAVRSAMTRLFQLNLIARLLDLPAARAMTISIGDSSDRLETDVRQAVWTLTKYGSGLPSLTSSVTFTIAALAVMASIDVRITLLSLLPSLLVVLATYLTGRQVQRNRTRARGASGEVVGLMAEVFGGIQAVKLAGAQPWVQSRLNQLNAKRRAATVRDLTFALGVTSLSGAVLAIGTGLILLTALEPMRRGDFSVGDLVLFMYLLTEVGIGVSVTGAFINTWRQAQTHLHRLNELQQGQPMAALATGIEVMPVRPLPPSAVSPAPPPRHAHAAERLETLTVHGMSATHLDGCPAVTDISFTLRRGSVTVITGKVSAGKTTLLRCLLGMIPIDSGSIRWNGNLVERPARFFVPPRSSYTPQVPRLFSESIRDNILLGVDIPDAAIQAALAAAAFDTDLAEMLDGHDTLIGPRGYRLSGGQTQRLAAARMFARNADLMIIDDLSSALDNRTETTVWENLFALTQNGHAALVVSNRREALARADTIIVLDNGRISATGTLSKLLKESDTIHAIWTTGKPNKN